jgi:hypothetical protein
MATHFQRALSRARAFADAHGMLVRATADTVQDGFKLGQWLANQRSKDRAYQLRHGAPSPRALALSAIDPWWNPPWPYHWHRTYHQAREHHHTGQPCPPALQQWADTQRTRWDALHPQQQHLLTTIGIFPS